MHPVFADEIARARVVERQLEASRISRVNRLRTARRWQLRAERAAYRARLARLAIR